MSREYTPDEIEAALNGEFPDDHPNAEKDTNAEEAESAPAEEVVEEQPAPAAEAPAEEAEEPVEDDWQEKARKIQAAKDREVAQMQKELQQLREQIAEQRGREAEREKYADQSQSQALQAVTVEDLQAGIQSNLPATFQWTVANRPDMVPQLISMVRKTEGFGHDIADQMIVEYQEYKDQLREQKIEERFNQTAQEREAEQAPLRQRQAVESVVEDLTDRFGENFTAVQDQIADVMQRDGREYIEYLTNEAAKNGETFQVTPGLLREMMVDIYLDIREKALNASSAEPAKPEPAPAAAAALGGSSSGPVATDDDEELISQFIRGAQEADLSIDPQFLP